MYARVVHVQIQAGKLDEATSIFQESIVPAAQEQAGFQGIFLLTNPETGKGISVSLWDSEADMVAGEASGYYQAQIGKVGPLMAAAPVREQYTVSARA
jgi:heme-degrading monooxygenase HmoA